MIRFRLFDTAGRLVGGAGRGLYRLGLALSGWSGWLDAVADGHRFDAWQRARRRAGLHNQRGTG